MKNFLSRPLGLFSVLISGMAIMAISFYSFSFASEVGDLGQGVEDMEDPVVLGAPHANPTYTVAPSCLDNFYEWSHSNEYNDNAPWAPKFFPFEIWVDRHQDIRTPNPFFANPDPRREWMIDLNGDGLLDYIYVYHDKTSNGGRNIRECVYLNNGSGWDPVYRCYGFVMNFARQQEEGGEWEYGSNGDFYGDCAVPDEDE